jgi:uncharacterized membrane protein YhaH (DUF805 family)
LGAKLAGLLDLRGRTSRARYWGTIIAVVVLLALLLVALWAYALSIPGVYENGGPTPFPGDPPGIAGALLWFALLALALAAGLAATIRRLHDRDMAWWWILILVFVPDLLAGGAQYLAEGAIDVSATITYMMRIAAITISLWAFVELYCLRGTVGPNRFGPDPLERAA